MKICQNAGDTIYSNSADIVENIENIFMKESLDSLKTLLKTIRKSKF